MSPIHNGPMDAVRMFKDTVSFVALREVQFTHPI